MNSTLSRPAHPAGNESFSNIRRRKAQPKRRCRRIGFVGFDGVCVLDLTGPLEAFTTCLSLKGEADDNQTYELIVIGLNQKTFTSEGGVAFRAQATTETVTGLDTIIIPGGSGLERSKIMLELS